MKTWTLPIDAATLRRWQAQLFPEPSTARFARFIGIRQKSCQRFFDGERTFDATPDQIDDFEVQAAALKETDFVAKLDALLLEAGQGGVHPEIVAAYLAHAHKTKVGRPIE